MIEKEYSAIREYFFFSMIQYLQMYDWEAAKYEI
jgi:hypothetical protein